MALLASKDTAISLLDNLNRSVVVSAEAASDDDISTAFQEALLKDWGDGVQIPDEATETSARLSLLHGSAIFFLSQEASATKCALRFLSNLYISNESTEDHWSNSWNKVAFAEKPLVDTMKNVLEKFVDSEIRQGHLVDPIIWRNVNECGVKIALYCTTFASAVMDVLVIIRGLRPDQFAKHKCVLFHLICSLVRVQCLEIRQLVHDILVIHVTPLVGVTVPVSQR